MKTKNGIGAIGKNEPLDGYDPYSNSKSCSELVTHSYKKSFFNGADDFSKIENRGTSISTARAGNVIGGGDFANDRIIPDCVRSILKGETIIVRNPNSTRPYQHVLEPLFAYLLIAQKQVKKSELADYYNVGPDEADCITTRERSICFVESGSSRLEKAKAGKIKTLTAHMKPIF